MHKLKTLISITTFAVILPSCASLGGKSNEEKEEILVQSWTRVVEAVEEDKPKAAYTELTKNSTCDRDTYCYVYPERGSYYLHFGSAEYALKILSSINQCAQKLPTPKGSLRECLEYYSQFFGGNPKGNVHAYIARSRAEDYYLCGSGSAYEREIATILERIGWKRFKEVKAALCTVGENDE